MGLEEFSEGGKALKTCFSIYYLDYMEGDE